MESRDSVAEYLETWIKRLPIDIEIDWKTEIFTIIDKAFIKIEGHLIKEFKIKAEILDNFRAKEAFISRLETQLEDKEKFIKLKDSKISKLELEIENLSNKMTLSINKLQSEKDSTKKDYNKILGLKNQFLHEIKKKDYEISKMQDQLRKNYIEKDLRFKNSFEGPLASNLLELKSGANEEYYLFLMTGYMSLENQVIELKQTFSSQINKVFSSIQTAISPLGFYFNWPDLNFTHLDSALHEIDFRLCDISNSICQLQKQESFEDYPEDSIPSLKLIISSYKTLLNSSLLEVLQSKVF